MIKLTFHIQTHTGLLRFTVSILLLIATKSLSNIFLWHVA